MELEGNHALPKLSRGIETCWLSTTSIPTPSLHLRLIDGCQAAQKVQWDTTAMMTQLHHVFLYDFILCPLQLTSHLP